MPSFNENAKLTYKLQEILEKKKTTNYLFTDEEHTFIKHYYLLDTTKIREIKNYCLNLISDLLGVFRDCENNLKSHYMNIIILESFDYTHLMICNNSTRRQILTFAKTVCTRIDDYRDIMKTTLIPGGLISETSVATLEDSFKKYENLVARIIK